jgi:hypothetical protein
MCSWLFVVDGATIEENSRKIAYDGWKALASARASGGTYRQGASKTSGARCGLFSGSTQIDLITAKGATRGTAVARVLDTSTNNSVCEEVIADLRSSRIERQYVVPVTGLQPNKTYILEVVFDGCAGTVVDRIN